MRASLLKVLERLFGLLHAQNTPKDLRSVLLHFANDLTVQNNKSDAHWTAKVLSQIDSLKDTRDKAAPPQSNALAPATNPLFGSNSGQQQQQPPSGQQQQQGPSISREVQSERASAIQKERCLLGSVLYQAAAAGYCPASVIMSMLKWLQAASAIDDAPILHVCVATLAALDPSKGDRYDDTMDPALLPSVQELALDGGFVKSLHATVTAANAWKIQPLRNVLLLQWTLFYSHACQNKPSLENETEIWEETVEGEVYSATKEGAITFMLNDLLSFRALEDTLVTVGQRIGTATVDESFYESTLQQVQSLVITFISTMHTVLKKIKNREEDARAFNIHGSRLSRRHAQQQAEQQGPPPRDIEALFALVETVFRDRPDAGLPFWADEEDEAESHRLHAFLRWAADSRGQMATAFFVMLASLSTGEKAAAYAFDFLAMNSSTGSEASSSLCSWSMLFGAISHYANALQQSHPGQLSEMPPEEVDALRAFARLLGVIVSHSSMARAALFDNQHYQPVASLLSLIVHPISLDLKGDLIRAVAAFCQPGGAAGAEAARKTWMLLEQSQVLPTLSQSANGRMEGGIVTELEAVEVPAEVYPTTSAFIELLVNLVQTPTDDPNGPLVSIPEQLGAPARRPGVDPYLGFAIDTVLLPLFSRRFSSQKQKWSLVQGCLKFVENCLNTLQVDLVAFSATPPALAALVSRPGFDMMLRLLASTPLFSTLLNIAAPALDDLENEAAVPEFRLAVLSALRVLDKLFTLEGGFTDLVLPALMEHAPQHVISEKYSMLRATQPLSDALLQTAGIQDIIPRIAALVNFTQAPQIALFSVKIATALSRSRGFATTDAHFVPSVQPARINRLVGFFDASPEADSIARGYVRLLEPGAFDSDKTALYDAALDLLIGNTAPDHSAPNVAHYLLGYTYREEPSKPVEIDPNSSRFGLGSIIELSMAIEKGILPATLAERCFNLIANLCTNEYTARCTHRFLRTQYNFFATMLSYLPFIFPEPTSADDASGHFILGSEAHETTAEVVTAILQAEAWLLKSVALELNELAGDNQRSRLQELVAGLYTTETVDLTNFAQDSSRPQQGLPCIQDVLSSLSFEWEDQRQPPEVPLVHFGSLPFASCITQETNGVQLFDLSQVVRLLSNRKRELQSSGLLTTAEHQADAANEMRAVIEYLSIQNAQKQTEGARRSLLQAWSFVVDILVVKALEAVPVSDRHTFLFDTLDATLQALESSCTQGENADALSATADILVSTLREDQLQLRSGGGIEAKLSLDRLVRVLKRASDAILSLSLTPAARGELYAVLTHLLRLVLQTHKEQAASSRHQPQQQLKTNIASATSSALQGQLQRLVSQIARDAITSDEIWQMAALNLLDILTAVMHVAGQDSRLLDALSRENGIQNILASLKSTEGDLIDCLSIDPCTSYSLDSF